MTERRRHDVRIPLLLVLCVALAACAHVEPWQRGTLARRDMQLAPNPALAGLREHLHVSKEAAQGGHRGQRGGCGCN